ncbi:M24 family metallopeptidase [Phaeovulum sp.]|uniref:M24 family metallopeptidase n=1 Tax=Phaeovulum sp. TaxID=2934796 RepID=UPI0039E66088
MADYSHRLAALRARMKTTGTDLVALGPTSNMTWASGLSPHGDERPVMQIVTQTYAGFLMPALNADSQRPKTDLPFVTWADDVGPKAALKGLLTEAGAGGAVAVALDETMRADFALLLLDHLNVTRRSFLSDTLGYLRSRKDAEEYEILKENAVINDGAMRAGFAALREGITEAEVAAVVAQHYRDNGAETQFLSVCFGPNGAFPHHHTGQTRLTRDSAVLIDIGGRKDGYPSDMTRVGAFGTPPARYAEIHTIVNRAVEAALAAAKPGVKASAIDAAARGVITEAGFGPRFLHRTGHGLGIDIHEEPYITATADTVLEEGMVFSIEPGIYLEGEFGLRLEEIVIMRAEGAEVLSDLPRDVIMVPVKG